MFQTREIIASSKITNVVLKELTLPDLNSRLTYSSNERKYQEVPANVLKFLQPQQELLYLLLGKVILG